MKSALERRFSSVRRYVNSRKNFVGKSGYADFSLPVSRSLDAVALGTDWLASSTVQLPVVVSSSLRLDGSRVSELAEIDNSRNESKNDENSDGDNPLQCLRFRA